MELVSFDELEAEVKKEDLYPTKDKWMAWATKKAHEQYDEAVLRRIANGGDSGTEEDFKFMVGMFIAIADGIWNVERT